MSTNLGGNDYTNPLDEFRTYSTHFILSVASSTETFREMIGNDRDGSSPLIARVNDVKNIGGAIKVGDNKEAYLLVDTRRFSQYSITDVDMNHIYGTGSRLNPTVPAGELKMKIIDTTGLTFFTLLMETMRNKIQSSRASAFFLLTILFVGHSTDGTTKTISTCYIPLTLIKLSFEFTSSGSIYEIEFLELEGAPQKGATTQQIDYLGKLATISNEGQGANNLGSMVNALERLLNIRSLEFYQKYSDSAKVGSEQNKQTARFGKLVQYMINIPDDWKKFTLTTAARSRNIEQKHKAEKTTKLPAKTQTEADANAARNQNKIRDIQLDNRHSFISFSDTTTITDALKIMLESCVELLDLASEEKRKNGEAIAYKTVMSLTSDDTTFTIHLDVYPYYLPKLQIEKTNTTANGQNRINDTGSKSQIKNLIHYDYIFTGKNSHITDLKIQYNTGAEIALDQNIQLGSARAAKLASNGGQKISNVRQESKGATTTTSFDKQIKLGDPIFPSMQSVEQKKNTASMKTEEFGLDKAQAILKSKQEYTQTFAQLHFISSINLEMSIRGNPNLLRKYADRNERGGIPPHSPIITTTELNKLALDDQNTATKNFDSSIKKGLESSKAYYVENYYNPKIKRATESKNAVNGRDALLNQVDVATSPVFVELNILAPNVDFNGNNINGESLFTNKFFFQGPYNLLFVNSKFSDGEFSQSLVMIPYDLDGSYTESGDVNNARKL